MNLDGKRVVVVGLGRTGRSVATFCRDRGAEVLAVDDQPEEQLPRDMIDRLRAAGIETFFGGQPTDRMTASDLVVVSPGVPPSEPVAACDAAGVPVIGEIELASRYVDAPIVGITGTNGKSTVTGLVGAMLERTGRPTFVGGNFGTPLIEAVGTAAAAPGGALVVELSSFQLERIERFRPAQAVLLNVTEDHLDRYRSMAAYAAAKARVFERQTAEDHAVVNGDDPLALSLARAGRAELHRFGRESGEVHDQGDALVDEVTGERYATSALTLVGAHNRLNACAAILTARLAGASPEAIAAGLASFRGLPHRMELVGEGAGLRFYNDSKATNVGAAVAAIDGLDRPAVLIVGGKDKGGDYGPLRDRVAGSGVRAVVLIGAASNVIARALGDAAPIERAKDMRDAVERAVQRARAGDAVVLAPACSSFDMYRNFLERGDDFREAVSEILPRLGELGHPS